MTIDYLDFEKPIADIEQKIETLRRVGSEQNVNLNKDIARLGKKSKHLTAEIFATLTAQQIVQLARHPMRPYTSDYIELIFTDFDELHGDRHYSNAPEIISGLARLDDQPIVVIGHQKGRTTKEKLARNFGMPSPESFRKAKRLMELAERFQLPLLTFLDTTGAFPGIAAEEHNQSEAIARNLAVMSTLKTPIICTVIGEGCSGGALAIGVGDLTLMLQYSYYSVISPEGCASILWKSATKANEAAEALNLTADRLLSLGLIDEVIPEPLGGAHRDVKEMASRLKETLIKHLKALQNKSLNVLLDERYEKLLRIGA